MRALRLAAAAALLFAAGCSRYVPDPAAPGKVYAGRVVRIVPRTPPESDPISWDPGDGSGPRVGPELAHVWQRPGHYVIRGTGPGGTSETELEVLPRPPVDVVPADAGSAFLFPGGFTRLPRMEALLARMIPDPTWRDELAKAKQRAGVDPASAASLEAAGLDPAEGFGFFSPADDADGTWFFCGLLDEEKALALAVRVAEAQGPGERIEAGAGRLYMVRGPGEPVWVALGGGYLFARVSGPPRADLAAVVANFLAQAKGSIAANADFVRATAEASGTDGVFFARTDRLAVPGSQSGVPAVAVGVDLGADELTARIFAPLPPDAQASLAKVAGGTGPAALLDRLPKGAIALFAFSLRPAALLEALLPDPDQRALIDQSLLARLGLSASELAALLTGDMVVGVYADPAGLSRALQGDTGGLEEDPPPMISLNGIKGGAATELALRTLLERGGGKPDGKATWALGPVRLKLGKDVLAAATGAARARLDQKGDGALLAVLREANLTRSDELVGWIDLAALHDALVSAPPPTGAGEAERRAFVERAKQAAALGALRDLTFGVHPAPGGVGGSVRLRLRPE